MTLHNRIHFIKVVIIPQVCINQSEHIDGKSVMLPILDKKYHLDVCFILKSLNAHLLQM